MLGQSFLKHSFLSVVSEGVFTFGGVATHVETVHHLSPAVTGGIIFGGSGLSPMHYVTDGEGGIVFSGSGVPLFTLSKIGSGGLVFGGYGISHMDWTTRRISVTDETTRVSIPVDTMTRVSIGADGTTRDRHY